MLRVGDGSALVAISDNDKGDGLTATVKGVPPAELFKVVQTLRDVLDVDAPIREIALTLSVDPSLKRMLKQLPGIRVPGAFNRFEQIVGAILGQQVSVKAATTLAGRLQSATGTGRVLQGKLTRLFPMPERLVRAEARIAWNHLGQGRNDSARRVGR